MICAALCFHDEPPEMLHRCVASLAGVAHTVVALEGPWKGFDHPLGYDIREQREAIHSAAAEIAVTSAVVVHPRQWPSQIEKRDTLMQAASRRAEWTLVIDADDYVEHAGDELSHLLASTDLDVAEIHARYWIGKRETSRPVRRLFRASTGVRVRGAHNGYRTADGRWLHAPSNVATATALDLTDVLRLAHDSTPRTMSRQRAMARYYRFRALRKEETLREQEPMCVTV